MKNGGGRAEKKKKKGGGIPKSETRRPWRKWERLENFLKEDWNLISNWFFNSQSKRTSRN